MYFLLKEIEINSGSLIVIGVNDEASDFKFYTSGMPIYCDLNEKYISLYYRQNKVKNYIEDRVIIDYNFKDYSPYKCKILGKITDLKETDIKHFVSPFPSDKNKSGVTYQNYFKPSIVTYPFDTALESFISLLKSNNCFIKRWVKEPELSDYSTAGEVFDCFEGEYFDWKMLPENLVIIYCQEEEYHM